MRTKFKVMATRANGAVITTSEMDRDELLDFLSNFGEESDRESPTRVISFTVTELPKPSQPRPSDVY